MKTLKEFIIEDKVNYNHFKQNWQVRDDEDLHFKYDTKHIILKKAEPYIDDEAHYGGSKLYVYMKGDKVSSIPNSYTKREIKFNRGNIDHPFLHSDDNTAFKKSDYVEFNSNKVYAYYKI